MHLLAYNNLPSILKVTSDIAGLFIRDYVENQLINNALYLQVSEETRARNLGVAKREFVEVVEHVKSIVASESIEAIIVELEYHGRSSLRSLLSVNLPPHFLAEIELIQVIQTNMTIVATKQNHLTVITLGCMKLSSTLLIHLYTYLGHGIVPCQFIRLTLPLTILIL